MTNLLQMAYGLIVVAGMDGNTPALLSGTTPFVTTGDLIELYEAAQERRAGYIAASGPGGFTYYTTNIYHSGARLVTNGTWKVWSFCDPTYLPYFQGYFMSQRNQQSHRYMMLNVSDTYGWDFDNLWDTAIEAGAGISALPMASTNWLHGMKRAYSWLTNAPIARCSFVGGGSSTNVVATPTVNYDLANLASGVVANVDIVVQVEEGGYTTLYVTNSTEITCTGVDTNIAGTAVWSNAPAANVPGTNRTFTVQTALNSQPSRIRFNFTRCK